MRTVIWEPTWGGVLWVFMVIPNSWVLGDHQKSIFNKNISKRWNGIDRHVEKSSFRDISHYKSTLIYNGKCHERRIFQHVFDVRPIPFRDISIFLFKNWFWVKYKYSTMHFYGRNRMKWPYLVGMQGGIS